jgi:2-polyprenyl-6-methoxyphenol hydroxylase-like FAD-dependent oxidoreductase
MTGQEDERQQVVAVVGAGLVGSLEACMLAQRGMEVGLGHYS